MAGTHMSRDPRLAFELGLEAIALARRIGFRSFLATAAGNSLEVAADLGELDWAMAIGDELLALEFAPSDRHSLLRGIGQVRLLRGEPVDDLFAEYAEVLVSNADLQEVSNYEGALAFRNFLACDFAGAAALWEKAARTVTLNAASDLPRAARAAIWAGDVPTAERLTAEIAKEWAPRTVRTRSPHRDSPQASPPRPDAVTTRSRGYATAIATLRELGLELDAVLTMLDMARTLGATDPAVVPWLEEARASIERLRMPGLNGLFEARERAGSAGSAGSARIRLPAAAPGVKFATEATG